MNSFMSWVGGKKSLRDAVLARFPPYYERYIEVFGGAGWILFHKPPGNDFEVYNDFNSNLANLYRCVRDNPNKLKFKLRYVLDGVAQRERLRQERIAAREQERQNASPCDERVATVCDDRQEVGETPDENLQAAVSDCDDFEETEDECMEMSM